MYEAIRQYLSDSESGWDTCLDALERTPLHSGALYGSLEILEALCSNYHDLRAR